MQIFKGRDSISCIIKRTLKILLHYGLTSTVFMYCYISIRALMGLYVQKM